MMGRESRADDDPRYEPMGNFTPSRYGATLRSLIDPCPLMELGPGTPREEFRARLVAFDAGRDLGRPVTDIDAAAACHAGLWLLHDFWNEAHAIAQDLDTPEGAYWHAILHRREPDSFNAKYWLRRVGDHRIHHELSGFAADFGVQGNGWDHWYGETFVDLCDEHRGRRDDAETGLRQLQLAEWQFLFHFCWQKATWPPG